MPIYFDISGNQIDGARDYQEDAFMISQLGDGQGDSQDALVIMADGMGGHAAGNVASNLATSTFNKTFSGYYPPEDVPAALNDSLIKANDAIHAAVNETPGLSGMGCTMVCAYISGDKLWWVSVGDSHLYLIRDRELIKQNADHSYGGYLHMMREQGMDVEPDPKLSPNMLMSAMIGDDIAEIDLAEEPITLQPGDRIMIASDGLDTLGQGAVIQYSAWSDTAKDCVEALLQAVTEAEQPRQDNTTIVIVDVREGARHGAAAPAPAPTPEPEEKEEPNWSETTQPTGVEAGAEEIVLEDSLPIDEEPAAPPAYAKPEPESSGGGGKGMLLAVVALLLLAGGGAAWYLTQGGDSTATGPAPVQAPSTQAPPAGEAEPVPEPELAEPKVATGKTPVAAVDGPAPGSEIQDKLKSGGVAPTMVVIPAGSFTMGGRASSLKPDELPKHPVTVAAFAMSKTEVTLAEYDRFAQATGRKKPDGGDWDRNIHPVVHVSWDDAYAYSRWLSKQTGERYRLPSEAEWEYAARAGSTTDFWWGRKVGVGNAHCFDCKSGLHPRKPAKVGFFKANPFGLYDTAGNVMEWVHDCYHPNYNGAPEDGSVWEGGDCTRRVVRGGSYSNSSSVMRSASRDKLLSTQGYDNLGIRLARDLP